MLTQCQIIYHTSYVYTMPNYIPYLICLHNATLYTIPHMHAKYQIVQPYHIRVQHVILCNHASYAYKMPNYAILPYTLI